jgi:hypothetical protein
MNKTFLEGYYQALIDINESTKFGSQYQQYKTFEITETLRLIVKGRFENGQV